jgi:Predicted pPIWI-associating nuclease
MPVNVNHFINVGSFELATEALGIVKFRALSGGAQVALEKRFPDLGAAPNKDFIQVLASSVGRRVSEQGEDGTPVTHDEAGRLSDEELSLFAEKFLQKNEILFRDYESKKTTTRQNAEGQNVMSTSYGKVDIPKKDGETSTEYLQRVLVDHQKRSADYFSKTSIGMLGAIIKDSRQSILSADIGRERIEGLFGMPDFSKMHAAEKGLLADLFPPKDLIEGFRKSALVGFTRPELTSLFELHDQTRPAFFEATKAANFSAMRMLEEALGQPTGFVAQIDQLSKEWERYVSEGLGFEKVLSSHLAQITGMSVAAQASLVSIKADLIGGALGISFDRRLVLGDKFGDFSNVYRDLFRSFETSRADILALPPILSRLPTVEYYNGVNLVRATSIAEAEDTEEDYVRDEIEAETEDVLEKFLLELHPPLARMLSGARQALASDNPDRVRHFSTSLRELFTHVLHRLAPEKGVRAWSDSPAHYDRGRLTRKARLLYISRNINQKPFDAFVEKDIDAALEFLNLFQRGTHEVVVEYTPVQLRALEVRMDSTLRFLFEISQSK